MAFRARADVKNRKQKRRPRKPKGTIGVIVVGHGAGFYSVRWSDDKEAREDYVLRRTLDLGKLRGLHLWHGLAEPPPHNPEPNFDYTIQLPGGEIEYLDLMEIAPLRSLRGGHSRARGSYHVGDFADAVWMEILRKSDHYGGAAAASKTRIHLLLYCTDWRFVPDPTVRELLGFFVNTRPHAFKSIVLFIPYDESEGDVSMLFPAPSDRFQHFDESAAREWQVSFADPDTLTIVASTNGRATGTAKAGVRLWNVRFRAPAAKKRSS
jgi:hypothetical protein